MSPPSTHSVTADGAGMLGESNKKFMFLFTDAHVADEGFLECE
jgi:hypothetical protein